jgi:hypothetical protein
VELEACEVVAVAVAVKNGTAIACGQGNLTLRVRVRCAPDGCWAASPGADGLEAAAAAAAPQLLSLLDGLARTPCTRKPLLVGAADPSVDGSCRLATAWRGGKETKLPARVHMRAATLVALCALSAHGLQESHRQSFATVCSGSWHSAQAYLRRCLHHGSTAVQALAAARFVQVACTSAQPTVPQAPGGYTACACTCTAVLSCVQGRGGIGPATTMISAVSIEHHSHVWSSQ